MVRIMFDYQAFAMQRYGGISKYFATLSSRLNAYDDIDHNLSVLYTPNGYLTDKNNLLPSFPAQSLLKKRSRVERWNMRYYNVLLKRNNFDVFHPTYYNPYFLKSIKKPYVITVHDMIHELFPEYFSPTDPTPSYKRKVVENASHIIAISESTKSDLMRLMEVPKDKISVIHHGLFEPEAIVNHGDELGVTVYDGRQYVLYVGERGAYKNFYRFMLAIEKVMRKYADIHVVCAGGGNFGSAELEYLARLNVSDRVVQMTVDEFKLKKLYKHALFFCYPSLYEGFGLPILEAFANDCPVAVSNTSCFAEVGGDAARYFDPYMIDDMIDTFQSLIDSSHLRATLAAAGSERLKLFSTESCLEKTVDVYRKLKD